MQLAAVYGQLGKRAEQKKTNQLVQQMKVDVKQEKLLSAKQSQKTFRRYKSSPRRQQTRTVSHFSIYQLPTLQRRSLTTLGKMNGVLVWHFDKYTPCHSAADSIQDAWGSSDGLDHPGTEGIHFQERLIATPPLQPHTYRVSFML